jgi:hypothetical protein
MFSQITGYSINSVVNNGGEKILQNLDNAIDELIEGPSWMDDGIVIPRK